ncbi:hypothetical protein ACU686_16725 [Yinghuangia aomiensis]
MLAFRTSPGSSRFELRRIGARQLARYGETLHIGAAVTMRARGIAIVGQHRHERIILRLPAGQGRALPVIEQRF